LLIALKLRQATATDDRGLDVLEIGRASTRFDVFLRVLGSDVSRVAAGARSLHLTAEGCEHDARLDHRGDNEVRHDRWREAAPTGEVHDPQGECAAQFREEPLAHGSGRLADDRFVVLDAAAPRSFLCRSLMLFTSRPTPLIALPRGPGVITFLFFARGMKRMSMQPISSR
jgi:hypothetical protein